MAEKYFVCQYKILVNNKTKNKYTWDHSKNHMLNKLNLQDIVEATGFSF